MSKSKSLTFLTFHGIEGGVARGMAKVHLPLVKSLTDDARFDVCYYVGHYRKRKGDSNIYNFSFSYRLFVRLNSLLSTCLLRDGYLKLRLRNERAFDCIAYMKISRSVPLITSALLLRANLKYGRDKGKRVFIAGNPHDRELYHILREEENLYNIKLDDTYLKKDRLDFVSRSVASFDSIVCFNKVVYDSYCKHLPNLKVVYFSKHILPSFDLFPDVRIPKSERFSFCFVAHPTWLKGLPYLLEAWRKADLPNAELRIGGALNLDLENLIESKYKDLNNVHYLGHIQSENLNHFFRYSHVCVVPSLMDASPTTVLEGMYCGLPCIVSKGCGNHTLVENYVSGIVVAPGSSNDIADGMNWFYEKREQIEMLGQSARATIKKEIIMERKRNSELGEFIEKLI